jgi:hypothetical protein
MMAENRDQADHDETHTPDELQPGAVRKRAPVHALVLHPPRRSARLGVTLASAAVILLVAALERRRSKRRL